MKVITLFGGSSVELIVGVALLDRHIAALDKSFVDHKQSGLCGGLQRPSCAAGSISSVRRD
jgi:hypothetical protein